MAEPKKERLEEVDEHIDKAKADAEEALRGSFAEGQPENVFEYGEEGPEGEDFAPL
jgi:hypothetical protein